MNNKILYVSGEESASQIKMRAGRLGVDNDNLYILCQSDVDAILEQAEKLAPDILVIDSIQTTYDNSVNSPVGSIAQTKQVSAKLINRTKSLDMATVMIGHVNKEGIIAGPKVLEHMVDVVLYFEGDRNHSYRIIRAIKNRYGSTNEIGVFEMSHDGLAQICDPSEMLLAARPKNVSGSCTICVMEGSRPIIAELQALVTKTVFPAPRRTSTGVDYNRLAILLAVLEKRMGYHFSTQDVYLNVVAGLRLEEPAVDLGAVLALVSGYKNIAVPDDYIAIGEIGLAGECRAVSFIQARVSEAVRLGFKNILIPQKNFEKYPKENLKDVKLIGIKSIFQAVDIVFPATSPAS